MTMWTDPVVEEIHLIRQKMLAEVSGNIDALMAKFCEHQAVQVGTVIDGKLLLWTTEFRGEKSVGSR
jgi:hypothetical protein